MSSATTLRPGLIFITVPTIQSKSLLVGPPLFSDLKVRPLTPTDALGFVSESRTQHTTALCPAVWGCDATTLLERQLRPERGPNQSAGGRWRTR